MSIINENAVLKAVLSRRSIRSYLDIQVTEDELDSILEAGIWAPTARNQQEVDFYVIKDKTIIENLSRKYSQYANKENVQDISFGAPVFILLYSKKGARFLGMDAGIAVENMAIAAQGLGLGSVIVGCFKEFMESEEGLKFSKSIGVPEDYTFCISIAIGHAANPAKVLPRREGRVYYL